MKINYQLQNQIISKSTKGFFSLITLALFVLIRQLKISQFMQFALIFALTILGNSETLAQTSTQSLPNKVYYVKNPNIPNTSVDNWYDTKYDGAYIKSNIITSTRQIPSAPCYNKEANSTSTENYYVVMLENLGSHWRLKPGTCESNQGRMDVNGGHWVSRGEHLNANIALASPWFQESKPGEAISDFEAREIYLDSNNQLYAIENNAQHYIHQYDGSPGSWTYKDYGAAQLAEFNSNIWGVNINNALMQFIPTEKLAIKNGVMKTITKGNRMLYIDNTTGHNGAGHGAHEFKNGNHVPLQFKDNNNAVKPITDVNDLVIGNNKIYYSSFRNGIYELENNNVKPIGSFSKQLLIGDDDLYILNIQNRIIKYTGIPFINEDLGSVEVLNATINNKLIPKIAYGNGVLCAIFNDNSIRKYDKIGKQWIDTGVKGKQLIVFNRGIYYIGMDDKVDEHTF